MILLFAKNTKRTSLKNKLSKSNKKQIYVSDPYSYSTTPTYYPANVYSPGNNAWTTLTTGTFSSGGNLYQTTPGSQIPYGTGYSYGPWQKLMRKQKK